MKLSLGSVAALAALVPTTQAMHLGLSWAAPNAWTSQLIGNPMVSSYQHWEMGHVPELSHSGIQFVPTRWGYSKSENWPRLRSSIARYRMPWAMYVNEPDVPSQANYSPRDAAVAFMREFMPLRQYGTKLTSPQICWNVDWLDQFTRSLHNMGGDYNVAAIHYYGSWNSIEHFKQYVQGVWNKFHKPIWVTEYGVTAASNPSAQQAKTFMIQATEWMASTGYVKRAYPFGIWAQAPDSFGSRQNAAFFSNGQLRSLGRYYRWWHASKRALPEGQKDGRMMRRHNNMLRRLAEPDPEDGENWDNHTNETHCDEYCQGRSAWLSRIQEGIPSNVSVNDLELDQNHVPTVPIEDHVHEEFPEDDE